MRQEITTGAIPKWGTIDEKFPQMVLKDSPFMYPVPLIEKLESLQELLEFAHKFNATSSQLDKIKTEQERLMDQLINQYPWEESGDE